MSLYLQKIHDPGRLKDLMLDLKAQDKLQLEAKKRKAEGLDDDGEYEAVVRLKLLGKVTVTVYNKPK